MAGSSRSDIISVLKSEIADFEAKTQVNETGRIISINDGIVNITVLIMQCMVSLLNLKQALKE